MPEPVGIGSIDRANQALGLTPEEQNLYAHHLNNLATGNYVPQPGGGYSSILQVPIGIDGRFYNIPTVWNGKILPVPEAVDMAAKKGWANWPSYPSEHDADARYALMHAFMEQDQPPAKAPSRQRKTFANSPAAKEL